MNYNFIDLEHDHEDLKSYIFSLKKNHKILIIVPDISRYKSYSGFIATKIYQTLKDTHKFKFLIATGTHHPMSKHEIKKMYHPIPPHLFVNHNYKQDCLNQFKLTSKEISSITNINVNFSIDVSLNKELFNPEYQHIISIGQVLPHEVCGFSNYTKNIIIGLGGEDIINKTHYLSAIDGIEKTLGTPHTPVRLLINHVFKKINLSIKTDYLLTIVDTFTNELKNVYRCLKDEDFNIVTKQSTITNIIQTNKYHEIFTYVNPIHTSTWIGNKAIYRLRRIIKDNGTLHIISPSLKKFGENKTINDIIIKYKYHSNSKKILELLKNSSFLNSHLAILAHLIHSSPEDRFNVIYYIKKSYIPLFESVNLQALPIENSPIPSTQDFVCKNPSLGLWI